MVLKYKKLTSDIIGIQAPAMDGDAGYDIFSAEAITIKAHGAATIHTMIAIELPSGYWFEIMPRSGLATKHQIAAHNGVVDNGYRGELMIHLYNHSNIDYHFNKNDRIAQGVIRKLHHFELQEVSDLSTSDRGQKGFGSTGK